MLGYTSQDLGAHAMRGSTNMYANAGKPQASANRGPRTRSAPATDSAPARGGAGGIPALTGGSSSPTPALPVATLAIRVEAIELAIASLSDKVEDNASTTSHLTANVREQLTELQERSPIVSESMGKSQETSLRAGEQMDALNASIDSLTVSQADVQKRLATLTMAMNDLDGCLEDISNACVMQVRAKVTQAHAPLYAKTAQLETTPASDSIVYTVPVNATVRLLYPQVNCDEKVYMHCVTVDELMNVHVGWLCVYDVASSQHYVADFQA